MEREGNEYFSLSFHKYFFPMGKDTFFPWEKMGLDPPIYCVIVYTEWLPHYSTTAHVTAHVTHTLTLTLTVFQAIVIPAPIYVSRGAEAGDILGVNTPPLFWAYNPHFLEGLKNGSWRGSAAKIRGNKKDLGGKKIFRSGKKFFRGLNERKMGG